MVQSKVAHGKSVEAAAGDCDHRLKLWLPCMLDLLWVEQSCSGSLGFRKCLMATASSVHVPLFGLQGNQYQQSNSMRLHRLKRAYSSAMVIAYDLYEKMRGGGGPFLTKSDLYPSAMRETSLLATSHADTHISQSHACFTSELRGA